jgi:hypothetical protein
MRVAGQNIRLRQSEMLSTGWLHSLGRYFSVSDVNAGSPLRWLHFGTHSTATVVSGRASTIPQIPTQPPSL